MKALAQNNTDIKELDLLKGIEEGGGINIKCTFSDCSIDDLIIAADKILDIMIIVATLLLVVIILYVGVKLIFSGEKPEARNHIKTVGLWSAIVYILILSSWLIVSYFFSALGVKDEYFKYIDKSDVKAINL